MARRPQRKKDKLPPRTPTADDLFDEHLREQCARAIVRYIRDCMDTRRAIKTVTLPEFKGMAFACMAEWIKLVSKRLNDDLLEPEQVPDVKFLLFGG